MSFTLLASLLALNALRVAAESHTVTFNNQCGFGTPMLIQGGTALANGSDYTSNGPIDTAIAYLQTSQKPCLWNGEGCGIVEMNIANSDCEGCGPSVDLSLIAPHEFNFEFGFEFYGSDGSCNGLGAECASATCDTAFFNPNDNQVQRACQADNINLLITFCGSAPTGFTDAVPGSAVNLGTSSPASVAAPPVVSSSSSPLPSPSSSSSAVVSKPSSSAAVAAPSSSIAPIAVAPSPSAPVAPTTSASNATAPTASSGSSSTGRCKTSTRKRSARSEVKGRLAHSRSRSRARSF